jgi:GT2 family glycosyltransferase
VLSIIIVNYNTRRLTLELLQSLYKQIDPPDYEIIVVDNASSDGSARAISMLFPQVRLKSLRRNIGFGRAVNLAVARSSGDYIWLLNSDCRIDSDVASAMTAYLDSHPQAAIVTGRLVNEDGSFQASCRRFPTFGNILFSRQSPISRFLPGDDVYTLPDYTEPTVVESCSCTSTMIRRSCFDDVGGFDERFFMYCEDTDLCRRFGERGWNIIFLPSATVMHRWAKSWGSGSWMRFYHHHRSMSRYFRKHYSGSRVRLIAFELLLAAGVGIRAMLSLIRRRA